MLSSAIVPGEPHFSTCACSQEAWKTSRATKQAKKSGVLEINTLSCTGHLLQKNKPWSCLSVVLTSTETHYTLW